MMTKRSALKILCLAISVALFVPIWGTFHGNVGIQLGWVAFATSAIYFASGCNIKEVFNVIFSHILGLAWGIGSLKLLGEPLFFKDSPIAYTFIVLCVFGFMAVIVTSIGISFISHSPSLFCGWAIAFAVLGGVEQNGWKNLTIESCIAMTIGVVFIGVGVSTVAGLLEKVLVKGEGEPAKAAPAQKVKSEASKQEKRTAAENKMYKFVQSYSNTTEEEKADAVNNQLIADLKDEIGSLKQTILDNDFAASNAGATSSGSYVNTKVKIIGVCGSPHKKGSTIDYLRKALAAAEEVGNVETELIELAGKEIKPCMGCKSDKCHGTCRINDYMQELYPKLRECDGLILASPSYFGTFSGQLKLFIDRLRVMRHTDFQLGNKVVGTLAVAGRRHGGQEITNIDLIQSIMRHNTIIVNDGTAVCQLGATGWSHTFDDPNIKSDEDEYGMQTAVGVGKRVAEIAKVMKASGIENVTYTYNHSIGKR